MGHKPLIRRKLPPVVLPAHAPDPFCGLTGVRALIDAMLGQIVDLGIDPDATPANTARNPKFGRESKLWLADKVCMVCGGKHRLMAHHKYAFHLFPSLEMDTRYWRPLCEGDHRLNCHVLIGHLGDTQGFNPLVDEFAGLMSFALRTNSVLLHAIRAEIRSQGKAA